MLEAFSTKDMANMLLEGISGIESDPESAHKEFWGTFFEDVEFIRSGEDYDEEEVKAMEEMAVENIKELMDCFY